jgi:hypothetical protein
MMYFFIAWAAINVMVVVVMELRTPRRHKWTLTDCGPMGIRPRRIE